MQETFSHSGICELSIRLLREALTVIDKAGIKLKSLPNFPVERLRAMTSMPLEEVNGHCAYGYKAGDTIEVTGLKTPEGFCGGAYNALFPVLFALNIGTKFPFSEDQNLNSRVTCPDGAIIRFKVKRVE